MPLDAHGLARGLNWGVVPIDQAGIACQSRRTATMVGTNMARTKQNPEARSRREFNRDRGSRQLSIRLTSRAHASGNQGGGRAARSLRRATALRASNRRATARNRQVDPEASIMDFLDQHPGSTTGGLAKGLNLSRQIVSTRLTQLAKAAEIKKASHGYNTQLAARCPPDSCCGGFVLLPCGSNLRVG